MWVATALYRRYRPESFAEVIGQDHVTTPLRRALRAGRVGHAYLFSGPRGCGKTTSARILARCLNCTEGPTDTPCGTCDSCRDLARAGAGSLDVVEIDAASHGGVDDARELRERASFAPVRDRFKVFIIDEAHMVTSAGFNALLKLVEEPPDHVKFVFATTEPDKVIGTIRSRTHHYPFRLIPPQVLGPYLEEVCVAEQVQVGEGVMPLVVRAGAGSARDSMSVLDQLMAGSDEGGLDFATAIALLGFTDTTLLDSAITAIAQRDAAALYGAVEHVLATGHEPRRFVEDLLERMRDLIVLAAVPDKGADLLPQVPADELGRMRSQATLFSPADLSLCGDLVHETLSTMSGATSPRLHLELLAARLVLRNERAALAAGEAGAPAQGTAPAGPVGQQSAAAQSAPGASGAREEARRIAQEKVEAARQARGGRPQAPAESRERPGAAQEQPAPAPTQPVDTRPAPQETPAPAAGTPTAPAQQAPVAQAPQDSAPQREQDEDRSSQAQAPSDAPTAPAQEPSAPAAPQREQAAPAGGGLDADQVRGHWSAILDELQQIRRPSWALVSQNAHVNGAHGGTLVIGFRTEGLVNAFHRGTAGENLADAVRRIMHTDVSIEAVVGEDPGPGGGGAGGGGPAAPGGSGPGGPTGAVGPVRPQASSPGAGTDRAGAGQPAPAPWGDSAPSMPPRGSAPGSAQPPAQSSAQPRRPSPQRVRNRSPRWVSEPRSAPCRPRPARHRPDAAAAPPPNVSRTSPPSPTTPTRRTPATRTRPPTTAPRRAAPSRHVPRRPPRRTRAAAPLPAPLPRAPGARRCAEPGGRGAQCTGSRRPDRRDPGRGGRGPGLRPCGRTPHLRSERPEARDRRGTRHPLPQAGTERGRARPGRYRRRRGSRRVPARHAARRAEPRTERGLGERPVV